LKEKKIRLDQVVNIEVDEEALVRRLTGRRQCEKCNQMYHVNFAPPQADGICDRCGGRLFQRDDDKEETIRARLKVYREQTQPLIDHYRNEGLLSTIKGEGPVDKVFDSILEALEKSGIKLKASLS
jgi:adenylate kinase